MNVSFRHALYRQIIVQYILIHHSKIAQNFHWQSTSPSNRTVKRLTSSENNYELHFEAHLFVLFCFYQIDTDQIIIFGVTRVVNFHFQMPTLVTIKVSNYFHKRNHHHHRTCLLFYILKK